MASAEEEQRLMAALMSQRIRNDPEAFVQYVFPWGKKNTPLEHFTGPKVWQRKILRRIAAHVARNNAAGNKDDFEVMKHAVCSGRGIGKSSLVAWLILWMMSTRIGSSTIVSANSEAQLKSYTWGELVKWSTLAIHSHWFDISSLKIAPTQWLATVVERDLGIGTRQWYAEGKLWSEENPNSYAGAHNMIGTMLLFDEASGIPSVIWETARGFLTDPTPNRFQFAFSNGRNSEGYFYDIFKNKKQGWTYEHIDARLVEDTDKKIYEEIIADNGEDSDEARIEVYGQFPRIDDVHFIPEQLIDDAMGRPKHNDPDAVVVIGVDPAAGGRDHAAIVVRKGRDVIDLKRFKTDDLMEVVGEVISMIRKHNPNLTVVDEGGCGKGVIDRIKEQGYKARGVNFGWSSSNKAVWANKRVEMWDNMKDWLKDAHLPLNRQLREELLTAREDKKGSLGQMKLMIKEDTRTRSVSSPDMADALAVTFAYDVFVPMENKNNRVFQESDYYGDTSYQSWMAF
jgi:hypothetical protein